MARGHAAEVVDIGGEQARQNPSEVLYRGVVDEVRNAGLTVSEMASVIGVNERQVRNWSTGENTPAGGNRDKLLQLYYVVQQLREVYTSEGAEIWLHGRKRSLGGRRPVELLASGEYDEVLAAIERLRSGAM